MNFVALIGRLTRDPEIRYSQGENAMAIARFTLAVDKNFKKKDDKANYSDSLQNVIMCHLSSENADSGSFIEKMKKVACGANVDVAERNKEWLLANPNECPF